MRALSAYNRVMGCVLLATLGGGFLLNTWVNPWRVTPEPWTSAKFDDARAIDRTTTRTCKAGLARSGSWEAAVFGSSRADIGFDPQDPAWGGLKAVNLGLDAANIDENEALFDYFMATQSPKLVVFLVDAGDLTKPDPAFNGTDFARSPLVPDAHPLDRWLSYNAGVTALSASLQTVGRATRHRTADHTPQGFRRVAERVKDPRSLIASLYLSTVWRLAHDRAGYAGMNATKVAMLERVIARCREKGARLVLVMPPNHAFFQCAFVALDEPDPYLGADRRKLAEVVEEANRAPGMPVELWDFQDGHPLNSPALPPPKGGQMEDWVDIFHFTPRLGSLILRRIQGQAGDYGVRLTTENVAGRIESVRLGLEQWEQTHPDDLAFLRQSLDAFGPLPRTEGSR